MARVSRNSARTRSGPATTTTPLADPLSRTSRHVAAPSAAVWDFCFAAAGDQSSSRKDVAARANEQEPGQPAQCDLLADPGHDW